MPAVDAGSLFDECMKETDYSLTATDVSNTLLLPFSLWCEKNVDKSEQDPSDSIYKKLSEAGNAHEAEVLESMYPNAVMHVDGAPEELFRRTLESMEGGTGTLAQPTLFYLPFGMHGRPDVLERQDGESALGRYHYVVKEIKIAKDIKDKHLLQAAFYNLMLGKIQGYVPDVFYLINGKMETKQYEYADYEEKLLGTINKAVSILRGEFRPDPVYTKETQWHSYSSRLAEENDDVSLICNIGVSTREKFKVAGFNIVHDVAGSSVEALMSVHNVGEKRAMQHHTRALAIVNKECVRRQGRVDLPGRSMEIFIDLEGLNKFYDPDVDEYLIGMTIRKNGDVRYKYFFAEDKREDLMLAEFLEFMAKQEDYVMYHWNHYERTHMNGLLKKYDRTDCSYLTGKDLLIDLLPVATGAFAFPTYSDSIKKIAPLTGFEWKQEDVGAMSSMDLYLNYVADPASNRADMEKVLQYNKDDCNATLAVKDWLVELS